METRTRETLEGELLGFTARASDGGSWAVARVRQMSGVEVAAVGALAHLKPGQRIQASGQWALDLRYGRQFRVDGAPVVEDPKTLHGMVLYLSEAFPGLGKERARRVVETFGADTLRVLDETPARLKEVGGIGKKTIQAITDQQRVERTEQELTALLRGYGLGVHLVKKVRERFQKEAFSIVSSQPYRLTEIHGIGFKTADRIARAGGTPPEDPARIAAAVEFVLEEGEESGSCFLPQQLVLERLAKLEIAPELARARLDALVEEKKITRYETPLDGQQPIFRAVTDRVEARVARLILKKLLEEMPPLVMRGAAGIDVARAEAAVGLTLSQGQRVAVERAMSSPLAVITGGPGTGKTTIVRVLLEALRQAGQRWRLAAPTGRAARRLAESTGQEASTLHRLLEFQPASGRFARDNLNPIPDGDAPALGVLVDESSMIDLWLLHRLLDALPFGCRLVLVGDVDQLPSVGAGQVLSDLIRSGVVPVARLTEVYRQAADSAIVRNAHRINHGEDPVSSEREEGKRDFFLLPREEPEEIRRLLLQVLTERLPRLDLRPQDVQVLTPMHQGPLGTVALNALLQGALNKDGQEFQRGDKRLRVGDRVIQTKNDYEREIFNGDVGRVIGVLPAGVRVEMEGRQLSLEDEAMDALELAYAISIHKSQGSEYPAVVTILHTAHFVLLRRNLLYTAVTRAKRFACVLGSPRAFRLAVQRAGGDERFTRLADRLQGPA